MNSPLPSIYTIPFNGPMFQQVFCEHFVVQKDDIKNLISQHMNQEYLDLIDCCHGTSFIEENRMFETAYVALSMLSYRLRWIPDSDLPPVSVERATAVITELGPMNANQVSLVSTIFMYVWNHCRNFVVPTAYHVPTTFVIHVRDQRLLKHPLFPSIDTPDVCDCSIPLIHKDTVYDDDTLVPFDDDTRYAFCYSYTQICYRMIDMALDIIERILRQTNYIK